MIKLIVTDIDGTLVKDGTLDINPEYMDVIQTVVCTGKRPDLFYFGWRYSDPYIGGNIKSSYIVC